MSGAPVGADFGQIARAKLSRVLGPALADSVLERTLRLIGLESLSSADDLYRFSSELGRNKDPIAAAVGGLLGVTALLHGAKGK